MIQKKYKLYHLYSNVYELPTGVQCNLISRPVMVNRCWLRLCWQLFAYVMYHAKAANAVAR